MGRGRGRGPNRSGMGKGGGMNDDDYYDEDDMGVSREEKRFGVSWGPLEAPQAIPGGCSGLVELCPWHRRGVLLPLGRRRRELPARRP